MDFSTVASAKRFGNMFCLRRGQRYAIVHFDTGGVVELLVGYELEDFAKGF
jgi:hypothetical protein